MLYFNGTTILTNGGGHVLIIKKSQKTGYIIYDSKDFTLHTHISDLKIAHIVKRNVRQSKTPHTRSKWLIYCHIRLTRDNEYKNQLYAMLKEQ